MTFDMFHEKRRLPRRRLLFPHIDIKFSRRIFFNWSETLALSGVFAEIW